jgi:DNA-directed RNA polymerase sigma subunit (sigma70/sigma32)
MKVVRCPFTGERRGPACESCVDFVGGAHRGCFVPRTANFQAAMDKIRKTKDAEMAYESMKQPMNTPFDDACATSARRLLMDVLDTLTEREKTIIVMRFGLTGPDMTAGEVGRRLSITGERVRQLEARAIRKLRHPTRSRKLLEACSFR